MNDIIAMSQLAARLHAGQVDKAGAPYIDHLTRVAENLLRRWPDASHAEVAAAWLHDALEDTDATVQSLLAAGVPAEAVEIVQAVTKPEGAIYLDWISELASTGPIGAVRVKLADNDDNRDPARVAALPGASERVVTRYEPARKLLEARLSAGVRP
jgi:(p)ppGpp synthase/HD superfamily hydrolase